jgi:hypothetical protein
MALLLKRHDPWHLFWGNQKQIVLQKVFREVAGEHNNIWTLNLLDVWVYGKYLAHLLK